MTLNASQRGRRETIILTVVGVVLVIGIFFALNLKTGGGQTYLSCDEMNARPGTDAFTAKCTNENGDVTTFREWAGR